MDADLEELPVADESVAVDVVDGEGEPELGLLVPLDAELADALDELLEVDLAVPVLVEDVNHPLHQGVLLKFWKTSS